MTLEIEKKIPTLPYREWLKNIKEKPSFKYKIVRYKNQEIKMSTMTQEEESEYRAFWLFHNDICKTGCYIGGEYISGWLYFHLNYFKIPIDDENDLGSRNASLGDFRDNDHMIAHYLERATKEEKHLMIFGTRRFAKSVFIASRLAYRSFLYANTTSVGIFGSDNDMGEVGNYYKIFFENKEDCFQDLSIVGKTFSGTDSFDLGFKLSKGADFEKLSTVKTVNLGMGESTKATEALAGISPSEVILDEPFADYTILRTPKGDSTIKDIQVGDFVFNKEGKPVEVYKKVYGGEKECIRITLHDGRSIDACEDHIWEIWDNSKSDYRMITTKDIKRLYLNHQIDKRYDKIVKKRRFSIDLCGEVEYEEKKHIISPYYIGTYLADGSRGTSSIISPDKEILDYIENENTSLGCKSKYKDKGEIAKYIFGVNRKGSLNPILQEYKRLEIFRHKKIPKEYLEDSIENRKQLLAGLLDSDGYISAKGNIEYCTSYEPIRDGFIQLCAGLGIRYSVSIKKAHYRLPNGEKKICRDSYRFKIYPKFNPFNLPRKRERFIVYDNRKADFYRKRVSIENVESIGKHNVYCIGVKSEDSLFLVGEYVVTKNCGKFNFAERWAALLPAFETGFGLRCSAVLTGTGGNVEASQTAESMFLNADIHNLLVVSFDDYKQKYNHFMYTQESDKKVSLFVPGVMSLGGGRKIETPFAEYSKRNKTKKELEELEGFNIKVTDWENAKKRIDDIIEKEYKKGDKDGNKATMYYPSQPEDCFLHKGNNPFDAALCTQLYNQKIGNNLWGKAVMLKRNNGQVEVMETSKKPYKEFPYKGGFYDAPVMIYEDPLVPNPQMYCYVAGFDGYRILEDNKSDSMGAMYVLKMVGYSFEMVASYVSRPSNINEFNEQCLALLEYYNAICLAERADMNMLKIHIERNRKLHLLSKEISVGKQIESQYKNSFGKPYGQSASRKDDYTYMENLTIEHSKELIEEQDENGNIINSKTGLENIQDPMLLLELSKFSKGGNFDRYSAYKHALLMGEEVIRLGVVPQLERKTVAWDNRNNAPINKPIKRPEYNFGKKLNNGNFSLI
jgi:hypothetical protein